jgi:predicted patatin/cPLA2 family phospholipase
VINFAAVSRVSRQTGENMQSTLLKFSDHREQGGPVPVAEAVPDTGLVLAGGGFRCAFSAGALEALHDFGLGEFSAAQAVSGGAPTLAYFLAGQVDRIREIGSEMMTVPEVVRYRTLLPWGDAWRSGEPLFDTDFLVDEVYGRQAPLDAEALAASPTRFRMLAARTDHGGLALQAFDNDESDVAGMLKSCLALPGLSVSPHFESGRSFVDGSLLAPIPFQWRGRPIARRTIVILNSPRGRKPSLSSLGARMLLKALYRGSGPVEAAIRGQAALYARTLDILLAAERRGEVLVISPRRRTPTAMASRSARKMRQSMDLGYLEVSSRRREIERFLEGRRTVGTADGRLGPMAVPRPALAFSR